MRSLLASLQWTLFILAGSIVVPITVAATYGLSPEMTVEFVQRTLFVLGISGILQALFGHKLPVQEGPAGLWWGVFVLYASLGSVLFGSELETLRALQFAFLLSGLIFIFLSAFGLVERLARLISPTVVGVYLLLLVIQLSGSFLNGMAGVTTDSALIQPKVLALSLFIIIISFIVMRLPKVGHYSVLVTMVLGWTLFKLFGLGNPVIAVNKKIQLPEIFAFGLPEFETNLVVMVLSITLLLLANMLATIRAVQMVYDEKQIDYAKNRLKQTGYIAGVNQLLGGVFSSIGPVPLSGTAGFIRTTHITERKPFIIGSLLIVLISLLPKLTAFVASIPEAVGYAALFPMFAVMIGIAFRSLNQAENKEVMYQVAGISLLTGIGVMFIPAEAFKAMSPTLTSILSNGLVLGSLLAIILDYKKAGDK